MGHKDLHNFLSISILILASLFLSVSVYLLVVLYRDTKKTGSKISVLTKIVARKWIKKIQFYISVSVAANALFLSFLVTIFLFFFFWFMPHNGTVSIEIIPKSSEQFEKTEAVHINNAMFNTIFSGEIVLASGFVPILIHPDTFPFSIDGKEIQREDKFTYTIVSEENKDFLNSEKRTYIIRIKPEGNLTGDFNGLYSDIGLDLNGAMIISPIEGSTLTFKCKERMTVYIEGHDMHLVKQHGDDMEYLHVNTLEFSENGQFQIRMIGSGIIETDTQIIPYISPFDKYIIQYEEMKSATINLAHGLSTRGAGKVYFFNTSNPKIYELDNQEISCHSNGKLYGSFADNKLSINGEVKDVFIMGYNIIPSFWDWVKDNTLVIPSMVLTIFGGAITLAINNRNRYKIYDQFGNKKHKQESS